MSALTAAPVPTFSVAPRTVPPRTVPPRASAPVSIARKPRLRLTRRGRAVFTTLAAAPLVILAVVLGLSGGDARASLEASPDSFTYLTVGPGQSLWSIAETVAPGADPREVVADFVNLNALGSADVEVGERLAIPLEYAG